MEGVKCFYKLLGSGTSLSLRRARKSMNSVKIVNGGMGEWLKPAVLKTVSGETRSGVRIPLPPPAFAESLRSASAGWQTFRRLAAVTIGLSFEPWAQSGAGNASRWAATNTQSFDKTREKFFGAGGDLNPQELSPASTSSYPKILSWRCGESRVAVGW